MKRILIVVIAIILTSCSEEIASRDINKLVNNQLKNNRIEIDRIKNEIKGFKIEKLDKNISLMKRLDKLHKNILKVNDSIDSGNKGIALHRAINFINRNFSDLRSFNEFPLELNEDTPRPLIKLQIATLEGFLIGQNKGNYDFTRPDETTFRLDNLSIQATTSKTIIRNGEKITGELFFVGVAKLDNASKMVKKITLNGQEIIAGKDGWQFEITPRAKGAGLIPYELNAEAILPDTTLKKKQLIYIQN